MKDTYIEFLQYALNAEASLPKDTASIDWMGLMRWAECQAIVGIIYQGIQKSGKSLNIPFETLMEWVGYAQQIEIRNRQLNKKNGEIYHQYEYDGFRNCILKGQGVALYYPNPLLRTPGDIDIWLEGGRDKVMGYVTEKYGNHLERYHHVELEMENDIEVEIHFTPSYMHSPRSNKRLQEWFESQKEEQFRNIVVLEDCETEVAVPTKEFNIIYLLEHIYRHLFSEGIGLRQVIDYYYLLKSEECGVKSEKFATAIQNTLRNLGLWKFAGALMWVLHEQLGLEKKCLIAEPNAKEGKFLWNEIMIGGNFGQYDTRLMAHRNEGFLGKNIRMAVRNMRFVKHYPEEALSEPIFRISHYLWRKKNGLK